MNSSELNIDAHELTDEELEMVAAGFWQFIIGALIGVAGDAILHWLHIK
jgi:hypothetical protein